MLARTMPRSPLMPGTLAKTPSQTYWINELYLGSPLMSSPFRPCSIGWPSWTQTTFRGVRESANVKVEYTRTWSGRKTLIWGMVLAAAEMSTHFNRRPSAPASWSNSRSPWLWTCWKKWLVLKYTAVTFFTNLSWGCPDLWGHYGILCGRLFKLDIVWRIF